MEPTDLDRAIEVNKSFLDRRTFNETIRRSEYHPTLTDDEAAMMLLSEEMLVCALQYRREIRDKLPESEKGKWTASLRRALAYIRSDAYQEAVRDVLRTEYPASELSPQMRIPQNTVK